MHNNIPSQSRFISTGRMPAVVRKGIEAKQPIKKLYVPKKKIRLLHYSVGMYIAHNTAYHSRR